MNNRKELTVLHIIEGLKSVIDLFSGPFLITYFIKLSETEAVTLSVYNIVSAVCVVIGAYIVGRIARNRFKMGMFRIGILLNLIYISIFIILGDRILDYVPLVGALYGLSAGCYWYPSNLIKAAKIGASDRAKFFSDDRIIVTVIAIICPILLGTVITRLDYVQTAYAIAAISVLQLIMTLMLGPIENTEKPPLQLKAAAKYILGKPDDLRVMYSHFCQGMTINGGTLSSLIMIELMVVLKTDQKVGFATTVSNILLIIIVWVLGNIKGQNVKKKLIYLCGLIPVALFIIQRATGIGGIIVAFYCLYTATAWGIMPTHDTNIFRVANRVEEGCSYREEFFVLLEIPIALGRLVGFGLLLIAALSQFALATEIVEWLLVAVVMLNAILIGRYEI